MRKGILLVLIAVGCAGYSPVSAQPPGYSGDSGSGGTLVKIGMGWGEQLKPPNSLKAALSNLQQFAGQSNITVEPYPQLYLSSSLSGFSVIFITTDQQFQLTDIEKRNLKQFVSGGGLLVVDNANPSQNGGPAESSLLQMIKDVTGSGKLDNIPNNSPIFRAPFKMDGPPIGAEMRMEKIVDIPKLEGKSEVERDVEAKTKAGKADEITAADRIQASQEAAARRPIEAYSMNSSGSQPLKEAKIGGRVAVIFCNKGYLLRWSEFSNNEPQLKFGVNLIAYAQSNKK